mgnify:CR=1 FL=1
MSKKSSLLQRVKNFCARIVLKNQLEHGYKVWIRLDKKLPEAVGAEVNDESRIQQFTKQVKHLSFIDL